MKLVEKLAKEHEAEAKLRGSYQGGEPHTPAESFEAGFRKALELAAARFRGEPDAEWEGEFVARDLEQIADQKVPDAPEAQDRG
jgi:hypothetical protein